MKNIIKITFLLAFSVFLLSCDTLLPPIGDEENTDMGDLEVVDIYTKLGKSLEQSIQLTSRNIDEQLEVMVTTGREKPNLRPVVETAKAAPEKIKVFLRLTDEICEEIRRKTQNFKNDINSKSIPKSIFFDDQKASEIRQLLNNSREHLLGLLKDLVDYSQREPIKGLRFLEEEMEKFRAEFILKSIEDENWEKATFGALSASKAYTLLRMQQNDATNAVAQIVGYLSDQMGYKIQVGSNFDIFAASVKPYIALGEIYEAEIGMGAAIDEAEFSVSVNGSSLRVEDGKARYKERPGSLGARLSRVSIVTVHPLTGETEKVDKEFQYEVSIPAVSAALDKMNILYIGVDNPVSVAAAGISSNDVEVRISGGGGGSISKVGQMQYNVRVSRKTTAGEYCNIEVWDKRRNKKLTAAMFRVRACPNPIAKLSNNMTGSIIKTNEMQIQQGLIAVLEDFDFDAKCLVEGFTLCYTPLRQDAVELKQNGALFSGQVLDAIKAAKPGTSYQFMNVKGRCSGDTSVRDLNTLAFMVR